jgi:hypothetical protein
MSARPALALLGGWLCLAALPPAGAAAREVPPALREVAEGYLKNRRALGSFRCEFRYRVGAARDLADALKNGPTLKPLTANCRWLVDGRRICYRREIDANAQAALAKAKANPRHDVIDGKAAVFVEIPISGLGYLTDGTRALRYSPSFVANLMGPNRIDELIEGLCPDTTPWALGGLGRTTDSNPGRWILEGKLGSWRLTAAQDANGQGLAVVECRRSSSRTTYWFDRRRGYLPVRRTRRLKDGRSQRIAITDVRKCSGGRWFPARVVSVDMRAGGEVWRVKEIVLTALDADSEIKDREMALVLRRGTRLLHVDDMLSSFRLSAEERVGIGDLEALHVRCRQTAARRRGRAGDGGL